MSGENVMLTLRDASRATGLSIKAIRRRVERKTLPCEMIDGQRRVPMAALMRAGLMVTDPSAHERRGRDPVDALAGRVEALEARVAELEGRRSDVVPPSASEAGDGSGLLRALEIES